MCIQCVGTPGEMSLSQECVCAKLIQLCPTLCQAPLSMEFSRQEYWDGLPFPPPRDLPDPEIKPVFYMSPALTGGFFTTSTTSSRARDQTPAPCVGSTES